MTGARTSRLGHEECPKYLTSQTPLHFPVSAKVPVSQLHQDIRILIYHLLQDYLGEAATVGSNQFVYFDASDPERFVAPDAYVQLRPPTSRITSWKVWERGAPEVAIEILSEHYVPQPDWEEKLRRYAALGVSELLCFSPEAPLALRVWDRVDGNLQERVVDGLRAVSLVLEATWIVAPAGEYLHTLRIEEPSGTLVPTRREALELARKAPRKDPLE